MKQLLIVGMLVMGLHFTSMSQNLRFWTTVQEKGNEYIVKVYAGNLDEKADAETIQGVNLRYYYHSEDLQYVGFQLSNELMSSGFVNMGGQGNNRFAANDKTRAGKADRFAGFAPYSGFNGFEFAGGERARIGTMTFVKKPGAQHVDGFLIGADIFRAMTYTTTNGDCEAGCPVIVIPPPPGPANIPVAISLDVEKYGPTHSHLNWSIDDPDGVRKYIVERKKGNEEWKQLAQLHSEGQYVHGYVDKDAYDGETRHELILYRVRVVRDLGEMMSDEEGLDFSSQKTIAKVFPNPASDKVNVSMTRTETDGPAYLELYGRDGRLVYRQEIMPGSIGEEIDLAGSNIESGSYTVHLISGDNLLDAHPLHVAR